MSAKVALIGNMNNGNFALTRYLRDVGVDAHLLLFDNELKHFHPSHDTYDKAYQSYVHQLSWGSPWRFHLTGPPSIRNDLAAYEFLIGCGDCAGLRRTGRAAPRRVCAPSVGTSGPSLARPTATRCAT